MKVNEERRLERVTLRVSTQVNIENTGGPIMRTTPDTRP